MHHSEQPIDMGGLGVVRLVLVIFRTYVFFGKFVSIKTHQPDSSSLKHLADLQPNQQIADRWQAFAKQESLEKVRAPHTNTIIRSRYTPSV